MVDGGPCVARPSIIASLVLAGDGLKSFAKNMQHRCLGTKRVLMMIAQVTDGTDQPVLREAERGNKLLYALWVIALVSVCVAVAGKAFLEGQRSELVRATIKASQERNDVNTANQRMRLSMPPAIDVPHSSVSSLRDSQWNFRKDLQLAEQRLKSAEQRVTELRERRNVSTWSIAVSGCAAVASMIALIAITPRPRRASSLYLLISMIATPLLMTGPFFINPVGDLYAFAAATSVSWIGMLAVTILNLQQGARPKERAAGWWTLAILWPGVALVCLVESNVITTNKFFSLSVENQDYVRLNQIRSFTEVALLVGGCLSLLVLSLPFFKWIAGRRNKKIRMP